MQENLHSEFTDKIDKKHKTLVLFCTYKITPAIMSEFKKMQDCGVECVLGINNTYKAVDDDESGAIQTKTLFGVKAKCLLLYQKDLEHLGLFIEKDIGYALWHSTDYWAYVVRKHFKDFDFYWTIDYDCFLNAKNYQNFFDFYKQEKADLLVSHFRKENKDSKWFWTFNTTWAYDEKVQWYGSLFAIARYSGSLLDVLYQKRLEYKKLFKKFKGEKQWLMCEFFTTTEAMKNGFSVKNFTADGHQIRIAQFDLNAERIFNAQDDKIYHPIKENLNELAQHNTELNTELRELNLSSKNQNAYTQKLELELCKNRIKSYLSYQLGSLMIAYNTSLLKRIILPYLLFATFLAHQVRLKFENSKSFNIKLLKKHQKHPELLKVKNHLSYQLGTALIQAYKDKWGGGLFKFFFCDLARIKKEFKQRKNQNL